MITPVNGHLIIEPVKQESFVVRDRETYEEVGVVKACPPANRIVNAFEEEAPKVGDKVYFDSWLAARFPGEKDGEYFWIVRWEDVRAVEKNEG